MNKHNIYNIGLEKTPANFESLSPLSFLQRAASVYPDYPSTIHGHIRKTWKETDIRCRKLASALQKQGIGEGDTVSVIAPNLPELFEMHFGVPMCGAVLNAINTRLDADAIAFIFQHAESKVVIVDKEFTEVVKKALKMIAHQPLVISIDDPLFDGGSLINEVTYEEFILDGDPEFQNWPPRDEWEAISLNYTSGTTGNPKGVVYHHRGAYLNAVSNILSWDMGAHPVYLWTLPMFHCNGWCFPWSIAAAAGVSVSLRHVRADAIFESIEENKVTHFCAAPIVLNMMNNADVDLKQGIAHQVKAMTAGAAPPASVIEGMESLGIDVTHVYGLTETFGPCVVCDWQRSWDDLNNTERARMKARQGVRAPMQGELMVADPITMIPVEKNGQQMGEIFLRGNIVMKGYLKNPTTTDEVLSEGWFHTGDLAVWHEDNYIEIKDRSKDIIISGGENISSIEIEDVLYRHPDVEEVAVIAMSDEKWGEVPCAFVKIKDDQDVTQEALIEFCRSQIAHFKVPKKFIFTALPKTSTGKVQKYVLRKRVNE